MILGYIFATLIGLSLGLMGGGGSILTVPVLVYILDYGPKESIALSLAIVAIAALAGSVTHFKEKNINIKVAMVFGPIAMIGTYLGAKLSVFLSGTTQLIIFAIVMIIASVFMFKGKKETEVKSDHKLNYTLIIIEGLLVGILTGVVGVGGGFMIVPALVLLANIPMKQAVGTSLLIIALKSFSGFIGYLDIVTVDWAFLAKFSIFTILGIIVGTYLVRFIPANKLKKGFAIFLIVMGIFILYKNKDKIMISNSAPLIFKNFA